MTFNLSLYNNKKPTVSIRNLSVSRVFPVDDSAKVESRTVCLADGSALVTSITGYGDPYFKPSLKLPVHYKS